VTPILLGLAACAALAGLAAWLEARGLSAAIRRPRAPVPTGAFQIVQASVSLTVQPSTRGNARVGPRAPLKIWAPVLESGPPESMATSKRAGFDRVPLVVYVPGWGARCDDNKALLANLASHGFLVAAMDDVRHEAADAESSQDSAARNLAWNLDSPEQFVRFQELGAARVRLSVDRLMRMLDAIETDQDVLGRVVGAGERIDVSRVGVIGYSFGGAVAQAALEKDGRICAAVNLDGLHFGPCAPPRKPYLVLNSPTLPDSADLTASGLARRHFAILAYRDLARQREYSRSGSTTSLVIEGAGHADFSDGLHAADRWKTWRPWRRALIAADKARGVIDGLVTSFFSVHLRDRVGCDAAATLPQFPEASPIDRRYPVAASGETECVGDAP
jgi:dienelactone hydrolase